MKLYCLHEGFYEGVSSRLEQIKASCEKLDVEPIILNSLTVDYSNLPTLGKGDLLYNVTRGSEVLESLLINNNVTTFYIENPDYIVFNVDTTKYSIAHDKANIPSPKTIYNLTDNRKLLRNYVKKLGGLPIVLKAMGGTRGIGTIKVDNWQSLMSTVDYLVSIKSKFIMREFIQAKSGCRMLVLGDEVIAAADFTMNKDDFRNAAILSEAKYVVREYSEDVKSLAVKAAHLSNTELAGVDFLENEEGEYKLLEVNFPTGFTGFTEELTGVNIADCLVSHLISKAKNEKNL